jgi:hypothetical protein
MLSAQHSRQLFGYILAFECLRPTTHLIVDMASGHSGCQREGERLLSVQATRNPVVGQSWLASHSGSSMPRCHCVTEYALTPRQLLALNLLSALDDQGWDLVASVDMSIGTSDGGERESTSSQPSKAQILI